MEKGDNSYKDTCLVIGNGFDLNLGLPTGYGNFVDSQQFNDMVARGNELAIHLKNKYELQNWIDIENELKSYSMENADPSFKSNYELLTFALIDYLRKIDYTSIRRSSTAHRIIESISKDFDRYTILDYNYTESVATILRNQFVNSELIKQNLIKVHGEASKGDIIFGVEDDARIKPEHVFLRKAYPRHYKALNFSTIFGKAKRIIFFGHSLGETDHTYFQDMFRDCCQDGSIYRDKIYNKTLEFIYYKEYGYHKLMQRLDELTYHKLTTFKQFNTVRFLDVEQIQIT